MSSPPFVDYSCSEHSDCAAKNVGNCCGFYPRCVNVDFCVDYDGLQEWCVDTGAAGVCGFPDIQACVCESGTCADVGSTWPETPVPEGATLVEGEIPKEEDCIPTSKTTSETLSSPSSLPSPSPSSPPSSSASSVEVQAESFPPTGSPPSVDYSCSEHSDCAAKNVGNCCGFYPRCVNVDFCVDYDGLQEWCEETGVTDVCGWPDIQACVCESGACTAVESTWPETPVPEGATIVEGDIPFREDCILSNATGQTTSSTTSQSSSSPSITPSSFAWSPKADTLLPVAAERQSLDYSCTEHSDCAAKNVGNCCGFYPQCVNVDFCVDHEGLDKWCSMTGAMGVCGFSDIQACVCESGACTAVGFTLPETPVPDGATIVEGDIPVDEDCIPSNATGQPASSTSHSSSPSSTPSYSAPSPKADTLLPIADEPQPVDYSCTEHSDCAAKNVGNCCGFYPQCVNVDFCVDHEGLGNWCSVTGAMGVCGFSDIQACVCESGACTAVGFTLPETPVPDGATIVEGDIPVDEDCIPTSTASVQPASSASGQCLASSFHAISVLAFTISVANLLGIRRRY